jgi:hypothetical protein
VADGSAAVYALDSGLDALAVDWNAAPLLVSPLASTIVVVVVKNMSSRRYTAQIIYIGRLKRAVPTHVCVPARASETNVRRDSRNTTQCRRAPLSVCHTANDDDNYTTCMTRARAHAHMHNSDDTTNETRTTSQHTRKQNHTFAGAKMQANKKKARQPKTNITR